MPLAQVFAADAAAGKSAYEKTCAGCHGADGKGNAMLGAPNLTDEVWLYGGTLADVRQTILKGRNGRMPTFGEQLDADRIHLLTAYVYSLSNK